MGLFLRALYESSGDDGRWTAPGGAIGASYRFFGDGETTWSLVARGGVIFERWHASTAGCAVPYFFPDNCKNFVATPPRGVIQDVTPITSVTVDTIGLLYGARLELPVKPVYMALGAELGSLVDVDASSPGVVLQARLTFTISFRNHQSEDESGGPGYRYEYNPRNR
jgi:hypothetical protein